MAIVKLPKIGRANAGQADQDNSGGLQAQIPPDTGEEYIEVQSGGSSGTGIRDFGRFATGLPFLLVGMVLSFIAVAWLFAASAQEADRDSKYVAQSSELLMLSQRIAKDARESVYGQEDAFPTLKSSRDTFENIITNLTKGNPKLNIPPSPPQVAPALDALTARWARTRRNVDQILSQEDAVLTLRDHVVGINQAVPMLLAVTDEVAAKAIKDHVGDQLVYLATRQGMLSERIAKDVNLFAQGGSEAAVAAAQFGRDAKLFRDTEAKLQAELPANVDTKLQEVDGIYQALNAHVTGILGIAAELFVSQRASQKVFQQSDPLLDSAKKLVASYTALSQERKASRTLSYIMAGVSFLFLLLVGRKLVNDQRERARVSSEQNRATQDAILKLLDEMGNLADGDLTIQPEVTEQITGAIADSINFAVKEMRSLVMRIKAAAQQVAVASERSRQTANELTQAATRQAAQIAETTERVKSMAKSMQEMSLSAEKSAQVAQGSVNTAKRGAEAVQNTIHGMDEMREQIQETAKRIKRLGESSQQIGEIVELINDIAEQTNILSLNAAIQAAMAGEAGRGFAVVADEVQRLAERSGEATKQIADLVKTIQADTNEAVASMEQATKGVVEGTRLADAAGQALGEIESVSEQLSELIVGISRVAYQQSETATAVSQNMGQIQEATTLTSTGTRQTAESIGKLSDLARELQASVAGFKLPAA
ncbi:MAG: methyl-accepting chemotaxis protein [Gammaproteobacteria bacterium]|nr:methyl-accepting chemotaxis protein [Gammaproteobacteria bacterium]